MHACLKFHSLKILDRLAYAYFLENLFQQKTYPNKVATLEHYNADMLVLKRFRCSAVNDLPRFICVEALSQPVVFF